MLSLAPLLPWLIASASAADPRGQDPRGPLDPREAADPREAVPVVPERPPIDVALPPARRVQATRTFTAMRVTTCVASGLSTTLAVAGIPGREDPAPLVTTGAWLTGFTAAAVARGEIRNQGVRHAAVPLVLTPVVGLAGLVVMTEDDATGRALVAASAALPAVQVWSTSRALARARRER